MTLWEKKLKILSNIKQRWLKEKGRQIGMTGEKAVLKKGTNPVLCYLLFGGCMHQLLSTNTRPHYHAIIHTAATLLCNTNKSTTKILGRTMLRKSNFSHIALLVKASTRGLKSTISGPSGFLIN